MATANELNSLADAPGTSREYETIYVLRPGTTNEGVGEVNDRVRNIVESMDGKVIKVDNWGKRRLAYEVAKERKGIYLYWQFLATRGVVQEIERNLRMLDSVIRFMTVKVDQDIDPNARPSELDDNAYERAATTAADEEDLYLSRPAGGEDGDEAGTDDTSEAAAADSKGSSEDAAPEAASTETAGAEAAKETAGAEAAKETAGAEAAKETASAETAADEDKE